MEQALEEQKVSGEKLGRILTAKGWVGERDILTVMQGMMVVVFQLDGEDYGVETLSVLEIIRLAPVRPLPSAPAWLQGVIDFRGQVVPVLDMGVRMGRAARRDEGARIIVYQDRQRQVWGLLVDSVSAVMQVSREQLENDGQAWTPKGVPLRWVMALVRIDGKPVALWKLDEILMDGQAEAKPALEGGS